MLPALYRKAWLLASPVVYALPTTWPASLMLEATLYEPPSVPRSVSLPLPYRNARELVLPAVSE